MSKFDEAIATYQGSLSDLGISIDATLLTAVTKGLGPSIYNADSSKVPRWPTPWPPQSTAHGEK